ncbi:DedA family protein [Mesobacillus selenatarsenatis]|uniref:Alkaline phosphatase n=1 Tax=Mesobacillus selenatarsenatis (strain DSM 18680 / JCM 14380 / FERM P-15431 / SF-1) TaxID=1321606 RepID=A0A0A8XBL4_MESS1|nr:DedA family protein [Mesobacillus selenatarsenatis]GAM16669.1 alkaline phosphatase [Mesobacillus selenatarsenatis SF-1]
MEKWLIGIMEEFGYTGVMFLIALENIFPPIPSEVILTFAGFMTASTNLTITGVILASTMGSLLGAVLLYGIGLQLGVKKLERIVDQWGYLLRVTKKDIYKADSWFDRYGAWTVLFCRVIPLLRSLISIPAGISGMRFRKFLLFTTIGTLIWNTILVYLGASVGASWEEIVEYIDVYSKFIYIFLLLISVILLFVLVLRKRK